MDDRLPGRPQHDHGDVPTVRHCRVPRRERRAVAAGAGTRSAPDSAGVTRKRVIIRNATPDDAAACAAIYAPYVRDTAISFETEPPSTEQLAERIALAQRMHAWLVLEDAGIRGFAYGSLFKARGAYRFSCEVSVYVELGRRRTGAGRSLYEGLFTRLAERGYCTVVAGMTLPNEASVGLHRALGFELVGTYQRIGWKHGRWHDVMWMQRSLTDDPTAPPELQWDNLRISATDVPTHHRA
jgi:L-amino acid N-acyltransferase YncA